MGCGNLAGFRGGCQSAARLDPPPAAPHNPRRRPPMIDFALTDEQQQLRQLAHEFAEKEIVPKAAHHDQTGEFPREVCRKAWELGLMNTHIPEAFGGPGLGVIDGCLVAEEVAWGCTGIGTAMEANTLAEAPVIVGGSDTRARTFTGVKVPKATLLGKEGAAWFLAMAAFDHSRPVVSAAAVGLARAAMDHAVRSAKERTTFGVPIHKHQTVAFTVAEMAMMIVAAC